MGNHKEFIASKTNWLSDDDVKQFNEEGFLGPYSLFDPNEAKNIFARCFSYPRPLLPWSKGRHTVVREVAETATHPAIVEKITPLLGEDILLWGSMLIRQKPSAKHPVHVDVEHVEWPGISVWIGIENVTNQSSFCVVPGSHHYNITPDELKGTDPSDDKLIMEAARKMYPESKLKYLNIKDGQFIIFSGKLWHGTKNDSSKLRSSIILQYTTPTHKVKIAKNYKLPETTWYKKNPICLLVSGKDKSGINKLIDINNINPVGSQLKALFFHFPSNILKTIKKYLSKPALM